MTTLKISPTDSPTLKADKRLAIRVDEHAEGLTDWETDFLESVLKQLEEGRTLTDKQRSVLERIDEEKVD